MTQHLHSEHVPGCYRCDLREDEARDHRADEIAHEAWHDETEAPLFGEDRRRLLLEYAQRLDRYTAEAARRYLDDLEARLEIVTNRYGGDDREAVRLHAQALQRLEWRKRNGGKDCARCEEAKALSEFPRDARETDGRSRICRVCVARRDAAAYRRRLSSS